MACLRVWVSTAWINFAAFMMRTRRMTKGIFSVPCPMGSVVLTPGYLRG
jgi:hypothetical protein